MAGEKMKLQNLIAVGMLGFCLLSAVGQSPDAANAKSAKPQPAKRGLTNAAQESDEGELKFKQNCSRCHNAPQDISRRISGTVMLHMRARASLSAADERAILHYLAP